MLKQLGHQVSSFQCLNEESRMLACCQKIKQFLIPIVSGVKHVMKQKKKQLHL